MPALTANSVTLEEVLEVRGGPLHEQELWAILSFSSEALQDIFLEGKAKKKGLLTFTITPETLFLCHNGKVKFSLHSVSSRSRSFTAPETYSSRSAPSDAALEKICVYSLGMTLYHGAEYEIPVGKPVNLSESLENVLLSMCEESAQSRIPLSKVLQACHSHRDRKYYKDLISSLVTFVLGDDVPDIDMEKDVNQTYLYPSDLMNGTSISRSISSDLSSPRSLPSPPPALQSTRGQATSVELVGANHRELELPASDLSPRLNGSHYVPHVLEKYRDRIEQSRRERGLTSPRTSATTLTSFDESRPNSSGARETSAPPHHSLTTVNLDKLSIGPDYEEMPENGFFEGQATGLPHNSRMEQSRHKLDLASPGYPGMRRFDSEMSIISSSSLASGPLSMFSDGRSSSAISIAQGSYAPESYFTDGYESEAYITSAGSSVSQMGSRQEREPRDRPYSSSMDLRPKDRHNLQSAQSLQPSADEVDGQHPEMRRYLSVPEIAQENAVPKMNRQKSSSQAKLKTFFGPEFIQISEDPNKSIVNITPKKPGSLPHGRKLVSVVMLNGQKLQLTVETNSTTQELFDLVIRYLGLTEKVYFGITQLQGGEHVFLDLDVKLTKYAPAKWKEESKGSSSVEFTMFFRVKFYVENMALLSHHRTRHQLYLQLRKDILEEHLYCNEEAAFILGGLALQAETGDFIDTLEDDYFMPEHYVSPRVLQKVTTPFSVQQLPQFHQGFSGLSEEQAELQFLKEAQKLQDYGLHFYKVYTTKKMDKDPLWLGICVRGVTVFEARGHRKFPVHRHPWQMTKRLSFKKKKFFLEPRGDSDTETLVFYTGHYKKSGYLLQMCTAFHMFQRKMRARLATSDPEITNDESQLQQTNGPTAVASKEMPYRRENSLPSMQQKSLGEKEMEDPPPVDVNDVWHFTNSHKPVNRQYSISVESDTSSINNPQSDVESRRLSYGTENERDVDAPFVIDLDSTLHLHRDVNLENKEEHAYGLPDTEHQIAEVLPSPDREIKAIKLRRDPGQGLGITVLGGDNSKRLDLGIFVKSVTEGGPAWNDGRLRSGDRILAVNGQSLEQVTHQDAVSVLKNAPAEVELVVSQRQHNASSFDLSNIPGGHSVSEEPETLESKSLITPHNEPELEDKPTIQRDQPPEPSPSTFNFPLEDEPVRMISKCISPPSRLPASQSYQATGVGLPQHGRSTPQRTPSTSSFESEKSVEVPSVVTETFVRSSPSLREEALPPLSSTAISGVNLENVHGSVQHSTGIRGLEDENNLPDKSFIVELRKINGSLGLSVTGGTNTSVKLGGIYVKSLLPNGPADLDGQIRIGDRILQVNGISLLSVTHKQAMEIIKRAPTLTRMVVDRSVAVVIPKQNSGKKNTTQTPDQPFLVELNKGVGGLGLSLVGGHDSGAEHGGLLRIKKMFPGQPAATCSKLQIGDIILEVNGQSLQGKTHQEAINLVRMGPPEVMLLLRRDPSSIPQSLLQRAGSNASDIDPAQLLADIQSRLRDDKFVPPGKPSSVVGAKEEGKPEPVIPSLQSMSATNGVLKSPNVYSRNLAVEAVGLDELVDDSSKETVTADRSIKVDDEIDLQISVEDIEDLETVAPASSENYERSFGNEDLSNFLVPLAEDELSDIEGSRRGSGPDAFLPDDSNIADNVREKLAYLHSKVDDDGSLKSDPESVELNNTLRRHSSGSSASSDAGDSIQNYTVGTDRQGDSIEQQKNELDPAESLTPQEEVMEIELTKGSGGLGFTLTGGANTVGGCFVRDIIGGPALTDGRLKTGDQILKVDDVDIMAMKHMDAVNVLRATKQVVRLVILRRPDGVVASGESGVIEAVNLTRTTKGRIGLLLTEGEDDGIYVEDVVPGEPAASQGNLRPGDRIVEIAGHKVEGIGFVSARQLLDQARPVARLLVERCSRFAESKYTMDDGDSGVQVSSWSERSPDVDEIQYEEDEDEDEEDEDTIDAAKDEYFTVKLVKGTRGFGFSLVAASASELQLQGIFIKTITAGSVAEEDGRLRVGDQILKVNGEDVQGLSHARVIGMLRKVTGTVELEITRPAEVHIIPDELVPPHRMPPNEPSMGDARESKEKGCPERAPPSVDLDITLEDKAKIQSGSQDIKDEDEVAGLLSVIASENSVTKHAVKPRHPKPRRRDTDTVLTSLLTSLEPIPSPPESIASIDQKVDSQWQGSTYDTKQLSELASRRREPLLSDRTDPGAESDYLSSEPEARQGSTSIASSDSDFDDDLDVFDMLRDNSQLVVDMLTDEKTSADLQNDINGNRKSLNSKIVNGDVPPPIPSTPIPSDDEGTSFKRSLREMSTKIFSDESGISSEDTVPPLPSKIGPLKMQISDIRFQNGVSSSLVKVQGGGRYSGQRLKMLINSLQGKLDSNVPADEFKALREVKATDGCDSAKRPANKDKNRYRNVLPFEKTRVKLNGEGSDDYINASHVKVQLGGDEYHYIASQGPLPNTTKDFWHMIWEQQVDVIAMVTLEREGGKAKCHRYWPETRDQPLVFPDELAISLQRKQLCDFYTEREFRVRHISSGETMDVIHLNFTRWPDHGVPKSATEMLEFVRHTRQCTSDMGPIVVHCSAGIGRTGTLITVDVALGLMERDQPFDINKIIRNLREQRQGMIQTKDQYIFCYKACLEVLLSLK